MPTGMLRFSGSGDGQRPTVVSIPCSASQHVYHSHSAEQEGYHADSHWQMQRTLVLVTTAPTHIELPHQGCLCVCTPDNKGSRDFTNSDAGGQHVTGTLSNEATSDMGRKG